MSTSGPGDQCRLGCSVSVLALGLCLSPRLRSDGAPFGYVITAIL